MRNHVFRVLDVFNGTFEQIKRTVVLLIYHIFEEMFQFYTELAPVIVFTDFELHVFVPLVDFLENLGGLSIKINNFS